MHRHSTIAAAAIAAAALALLAGCSPAATSTSTSTSTGAVTSTDLTIGGVIVGGGDPYWTTMLCGVTAEAKKLGVKLDIKTTVSSDTTVVATALDAATLLKPDGMLVSGTGGGTISTKVDSIMKSGIPTALVNVGTTPATALQTIVSDTDNTDFAKYVASQVGTSGSIGILDGIAGAPVLEARYKPLVAQLKTVAPGIKVLPVQFSNFDVNKAATIVSSLILANPDLKAIYTVSGPEGQGALEAITQAKKVGQIKLFSYDATPAIVAGLRSGGVTALLAQSPVIQGTTALDTVVKYLKANPNGGAVPAESVPDVKVPLMTLTKANIDTAAAKDYIYASTCSN